MAVAVAVPREISSRLRKALSIVLDRPQNAWARDFILRPGEDPAGDVSMLSNPVHLAHAIVFRARHVGMRSPRAPPHARLQFGEHGLPRAERCSATTENVLIPAWTVGHITVGTFVRRESDGLSSETAPRVRMTVRLGRFVRDESTSETLIVAVSNDDCPWARQVLVWFVTYPSSTTRYQFQATCEKNTFVASRYDQSVLVSAYDISVRACSVCGSPPAMACGCPIFGLLPRSPLDFSAFTQNGLSTYHGGTYEKTIKTFGRSSIYRASVVHGLHLNLSGAQIQDALSSSFVSSEKHSRDSYVAGLNVEYARTLQSVGIQRALNGLNIARTVMPHPPPNPDSSSGFKDNDTVSETASQIVDHLFRDAHPLTGIEEQKGDDAEDMPCNVTTGHHSVHPQQLAISDVSNGASRVNTVSAGARGDYRASSCLTSSGPVVHTDGRSAPEIFAASGFAIGHFSSSVEDEGDVSVEMGVSVSNDDVPAPTAPIFAEVKDAVPSSPQGVFDRKALRRMRNREAAARSNAKRRAYLQSLKRDLEDAHGRATMLREQEASLREGNIILKDQAVKRWRSQMKSGSLS
jgi:hypothetical protein